MVIIRDEERIEKLKKRGSQVTLIGFLFLITGFVIVFILRDRPDVILFQTVALVVGFGLSQYGLYLSHRYRRSPRPDEVLDDAVKKAVRGGRFYHYVLPVPHVLLTRAGPIVFVPKYQTGDIVADGDKWRQRGLGFRRFFGQEGLGNPSREAEKMVAALAGYIRKHAPEVEEVPIGAMIVFTSKNVKNLDVENASIPAMHYSKVKGFLRQKGQVNSMPEKDYEALQQAFDEPATSLLET